MTKSLESGFPVTVARAIARVTRCGVEGAAEMCPPLTCLRTRDAGGVKHPLPLSRAQRNLVCQQVNLTQRPTQRRDKTVKQRQLSVSL